MTRRRWFALAVFLVTVTAVGLAEKANYALAARWMPAKVGKLVFDLAVTPHWLPAGDRFWYSYETSQGRRFWLVDPARKMKTPVFDNARMAAMLTSLTRIPYEAQHLPMRTIKFVRGDAAIQFSITVPREADIPNWKPPAQTQAQTPPARPGAAPPATKTLWFEYDLAAKELKLLSEFTPPARKPQWASVSPDEKTIILARRHNLYMMDAENYAKALKNPNDASIVETQLTTDGEEHFSYMRDPREAAQLQQIQQQQQEQQEQQQDEQAQGAQDPNRRNAPITITWAKDSKKFSVIRRDSRKVKDLWVINSLANPRPTLETYRYAMPGETEIPQPQMEVFTPESKQRLIAEKAARFKDQSVQVMTARQSAIARERDNPPEPQWLAESSDKVYFQRVSRDLHRLDVCVLDTSSGEVKTLIEERLNTYIETRPLRLLNNGQEILFWSERDGWGHWYLYDAEGKLKNAVTSGEWVTEGIQYVDEKLRYMVFEGEGREKGEDPYYRHLYRVNLDGTGLKLLDPGDASHAVNVADSGRFFVDNSSRVNTAPKSVLYDNAGNVVLELETTDVGALLAAGFQYPEPFQVKADDGVTDLYGVMYKPFDFDEKRKYPIIAYVYPGPQTESVTKTFSPRSGNMTLAQMGFIVIEVGNRGGNPQRSKWYHNYGYGNLRDYGLADKKAAIERLAVRHAFIDIDRVGITGHSGGGFMSAAAMLVYPEFFKVAVSESGNHENNIYNNTWSEKNHGIKEVTAADGKVTFEYNIEKNSELAKNLKGRLLLSTGDIDNNVHPANTIRLADALIKANKRFDFVLLPGVRHSFQPVNEYWFWTRADYFARWLLGDFSQTVDITEIIKEKEQTGDKGRPRVVTQQQQQGRRTTAEEENRQ